MTPQRIIPRAQNDESIHEYELVGIQDHQTESGECFHPSLRGGILGSRRFSFDLFLLAIQEIQGGGDLFEARRPA